MTDRAVGSAAGMRRNAIAITVGRLSVPVLNVLLIVLLARMGGAAVLGEYTFLLTACMLLEYGKSLGLQSYLVREAAGGGSAAERSRAALVRLGLYGAAVAAPLLILACAFSGVGTQSVILAATLMSGGLFASAWTVANDAYLQARERAGATTVITIGENLVRIGLSLGVLAWRGPSLPELAAVYSLSRIGAAFAQSRVLGGVGVPVAPGAVRELLRHAPSFFAIYVAPILLFRMDVILLGMLRGNVEVGVYGAAIRLISVAMILPDSVMTATFVRLSQLHAAGDDAAMESLFRRTLALLWAVLLPAALIGTLLAPWAIPLLFGPAYQTSVAPLQVLVWALLPHACARAIGDRLIASGHQTGVARLVVVTVVGGVALYLTLIPLFGAMGAAVGFVATAVLLSGLALRELLRNSGGALSFARPAAALPLVAFAAMLTTSCTPAETHAAGPASIVVKPSRTVAPVSPLLFGAAVEWTENGNTIYDPQRGELRKEILDLLRPLRISVWRFPGGILSDHYHWRDGVGPREKRPKRQHPMEESTHENNFGTDEFIEFCRALNGEALITANFGTGKLEDALAWQAYFKQRGFPVKYWEVGNEIYLAEPVDKAPIPGNDKRIFKTGDEYSRQFGEWARRLRQGDPNALVGAIAGTFNTGSKHKRWIYDLLGKGGREIDFIALHNSFAPIITSRWNYADAGKRREAYEAMIAHTQAVSFDVRGVTKGFTESGPRSQPRIAITEHFPLFGAGGGQLKEMLDQSRTLASGLFTASLFHTWMRDRVWMANYNIAVSKWFGALVTDTPEGLVRTPTYHVYDLYRNYFGSTLVESSVSGPTYSTRKTGMVEATRDVPRLDAVASTAPDGTVSLAVVNRNFSAAEEAAITVEGLKPDAVAEVLTIAAPSPNAVNGSSLTSSVSPGAADAIYIRKSSWKSTQTYSFPPHSITMLRWTKDRIMKR